MVINLNNFHRYIYAISSLLVFILHSNFQNQLFAQNSRIDSLLIFISGLQIRNDDFYLEGMFPSQRKKYDKKYVEDDNVFFTALVGFYLKIYMSEMSIANRTRSMEIIDRIKPNLNLYKNTSNNLTYNFWRKSENSHFPNSVVLSRMDKFALPDDFDDTSIIHLLLSNDSLACSVAQLMQKHVNTSKQIKSVTDSLRVYRAYSTWFGENMPVDFDLCVHSNTLLLKLSSGCQLVDADYETARYIINNVYSNSFEQNVSWLSQHYSQLEVVLYHIARVCAIDEDNLLFDESFKLFLKQKLLETSHATNSYMKSILISNALLMLGEYFDVDSYSVNMLKNESAEFYFFIANMTSTMRYPINKWFAKAKRFKHYYYSEAYNYILLLEHEILLLRVNPN